MMRNKTQSHGESANTVNSQYVWLVNYLKVEKQKMELKPPEDHFQESRNSDRNSGSGFCCGCCCVCLIVCLVLVFLQIFVQAWVLNPSPKFFSWKTLWKPNLKRVAFLITRLLDAIAKHNFNFLHWTSLIDIYRCSIWVSYESINSLSCLKH